MSDEFDNGLGGMDTDRDQATESWDNEVDHAAAEQTRKDSMLSPGPYNTMGGLQVSKVKYDDGRRVVSFYGPVIGVGKKNEGEEGTIRFRVSPDRRDKQDEPGTPDSASKLWSQSLRTFEKQTGAKAKKEEDVVQFLANSPYRINTFQGDDSPIVTGIQPYKE